MKTLLFSILLLVCLSCYSQTIRTNATSAYEYSLDSSSAICVYVNDKMELLADSCIVYFRTEQENGKLYQMIKKVRFQNRVGWLSLEDLIFTRYNDEN